MPILGSLASASVQSFGSRGLVPTGSAAYDSIYDSLQVPASTAFQYGTGDFTVEMWIYPTSISGYGSTLLKQRGVNYYTQRYLFLWLHPNGQIFLQVAGNDYFIGTANIVTLNAWNHVALVRRSGVIQIFLNGFANTGRANTTNFSDASAYAPMFGSLGFNIDYWFRGNISNIRVAKSAYYITSFIPDRTPFTRTSQGATNVQLLLNFKNASGLLTDSSANNITVTNSTVSLVTYSALTPFSGAFVTPPVVNAATAVVTPSTVTPNEGDAITFNVTVSNTPAGTYYWTIELPTDTPASAADISGGLLSGSFTVTGTTGSFVITTLADRLTEGTETFSVFVRSGSTTGIVLGVTDEITLADTSLTPSMVVSTSFNEGAMVSASVSNLGPAGTYYWSINHITTADADFSASSGSFATSFLNETIAIVTYSTADITTEGAQTFTLSVRTGSIAGPVIITSPTITLNDTSGTQSATLTPTPNPVTEGNAVTINFGTTNVPTGSTLTWNVINGTTTNADFAAVTGIVNSGFGSGSFTVTTVTGDGSESAQTFQVQLLGTASQQIGISASITISANIT